MALLILVMVAAGCGAPRPTVTVPLEIGWDGDFALLVYDESGLVTGARQAEIEFSGLSAATSRPDDHQIDISWTGGACSHRPTAHVSGTADAFRIELVNNADVNLVPFLPIGCPAVGLPFSVTLSLTAPVAQPAVAFEFTP